MQILFSYLVHNFPFRRGGFTVAEGGAVAGVEVALAGQPFGQQHGVRGQLDVNVGNLGRQHRYRSAVDEMAHRHQRAAGKHRMVGGEEQRAMRRAVSSPA